MTSCGYTGKHGHRMNVLLQPRLGSSKPSSAPEDSFMLHCPSESLPCLGSWDCLVECERCWDSDVLYAAHFEHMASSFIPISPRFSCPAPEAAGIV